MVKNVKNVELNKSIVTVFLNIQTLWSSRLQMFVL